MRSLALFLGCALLVLSSCIGGGGSNTTTLSEDFESATYAKGYFTKEVGDVTLVEITDPTSDGSSKYKYALIPRDMDIKEVEFSKEYLPIRVPLERVICMTTLQLSPFLKLDATDKIVGITSTKFLHNERMNQRLKDKKLSRIGIEGEFDAEVVISLSPDLIFISPFKRGGYDAIKNLDIPMMAYLGYKESSPLGQAEWIKLVGLMLGQEERAEAIFTQIETRYKELESIAAKVEHRPKILSGELHSGNWYVVGGNSYLAQLFRDAGADYFMENDNESGGFYVDYETVYSQGYNADYWRIVNSFNGEYGYGDLIASDGRYRDFKPFNERKVIYCNLRETPFYESTPMEPEVLLGDLIKIFHPTLLPDYEAVYYKLLR
ncbi:MAG: ABC transporter substrate-binding protein [Rikenellaceae bacterium]